MLETHKVRAFLKRFFTAPRPADGFPELRLDWVHSEPAGFLVQGLSEKCSNLEVTAKFLEENNVFIIAKRKNEKNRTVPPRAPLPFPPTAPTQPPTHHSHHRMHVA